MKKLTNAQDVEVYEFEDPALADQFALALAKVNAQEYVIDRMLDGIAQSFLLELDSGGLKDVDEEGLDVDSPTNVLKIAVKYLSDLVIDNTLAKDKAWLIAHQAGLEGIDKNWRFNKVSRQFSERVETSDS